MISEYVKLNGDEGRVACPECGEYLNGKSCSICSDVFLAGQDAECVETDNAGRQHYHKECFENATADGAKER